MDNTIKFIDIFNNENEISLYTDDSLGELIIPIPKVYEKVDLLCFDCLSFANTDIKRIANTNPALDNDIYNTISESGVLAILTAIASCQSVSIQFKGSELVFIDVLISYSDDNKKVIFNIIIKNTDENELSIKVLSDYIKNKLLK